MSLVRIALLAIAILPSAAIAQMRPGRPPVVAPPPIVLPPPIPPPSHHPRFTDRLVRIYFDYDSAFLSPTAERIVDLAAERALRCDYLGIEIAGHVDTANGRSRSLALSSRMAEEVRRALIARGLNPGRIAAEGFGASRPAKATGPGIREPLNRRVELEIICPGAPPERLPR